MRVYALRSLSVAGIVLAGILAGQSDAHAFGHMWGGGASCGSWGGGSAGGSYGGWGGSWGGYASTASAGSWGGGGSHGQRRVGLLHRIFHRHRDRASHGGWGGSHGQVAAYSASAGSWGGGYGGAYGGASYGGSYGGASYGGAYGGTVIAPAETYGPAIVPEGGETPEPPSPPNGADVPPMTLQGADSAALLTVTVPADAEVFVNDNPTTSTGEVRRYVSRGLTPGAAYTYRVRAEFTREGEQVSQIKTVRLTAGGVASLAFDASADEEPIAATPVETKLTLHVPSDAKVILAGNETQQKGEVRQFVTSTLAEGQTWSDYVVRVEVERNGQIVADEKVLHLTGGESLDLVMDLDAPKVAVK